MFNRKLKQVISIVTIEEATRRTAEWAQEITNTGKQLGITASMVQELNFLAAKLGLPASVATDAFKSMVDAQKAALENNAQVINQFIQLGATMEDLHKPAAELWDKIQGNVAGMGSNATMGQKFAASNVFGQPYQVVQDLAAKTTAGGGLASAAANNENNVSDQGVADINASWAQLKVDVMELGNTLKPVVPVLISFADAVVNAAHALLDIPHAILQILSGNIKGGAARLGGVLTGTGRGLIGGGAGIVDFITKAATLGSHGTHLGASFKEFSAMGDITSKRGKDFLAGAKHGEGLGAILPALVTEGGSAAVGGLGRGLASAGSKLKGVTGTAAGLDKIGGGIASVGKGLSPGAAAAKRTQEFIVDQKAKYLANRGVKMNDEGAYELNGEAMHPGVEASVVKEADSHVLGQLKKRNMPDGLTGAGAGAKYGLAAAAVGVGAAVGGVTPGNKLSQQQTVYNPFASGLGLAQSGGGNLKMGGLFGVGSSGEKLVQLNTKMEQHLAQISAHFKTTKEIDKTYHFMPRKHNNAGGI